MKRFKEIIGTITLLWLFGYFGYIVIKRVVMGSMLEKDAVRVKGVVINDRNYLGNSPVSHDFSYSYEFYVSGRSYKGDSHDPRLKVGDSVNVSMPQSLTPIRAHVTPDLGRHDS